MLEEPAIRDFVGCDDDDDDIDPDFMLAMDEENSHKELCNACKKWIEEWSLRQDTHLRSLSKSSAAVFGDWTKQVGHMVITW